MGLTNLNRYKDSGLANSKAIGLVADAEKGVVMSLKSTKRQRQIKRNAPGVKMTGSFCRVAKAITKASADPLTLSPRPQGRCSSPLVQDLEESAKVPPGSKVRVNCFLTVASHL